MAPQPEHMMHSFSSKKGTGMSMPIVLGVILLAIVLGVGTGYAVASMSNGTSPRSTAKKTAEENGSSETSAGVKDKKNFPDEAEGKLVNGGIEGEGSHHIERPGGESQNVYVTSTTVDLSKFVKKKVRVWGQTFEAQHAGWLMDVGYIEVIK